MVPLTSVGKLDRKKLREWITEGPEPSSWFPRRAAPSVMSAGP